MAKVTRRKRSVGTRIGEALSGVASAIGAGVDLTTKLENAKTQRAFAQNQLEQINLRRRDMEEKQRLIATSQLNDLMLEAIETDDPKNFLQMRGSDVEAALTRSGSTLSIDGFSKLALNKNENVKNAAKDLRIASAGLNRITPGSSDLKTLENMTNRGLKAFDTMAAAMPTEAKKELIQQKKVFLQQAERIRSDFTRSEQLSAKGPSGGGAKGPVSAETVDAAISEVKKRFKAIKEQPGSTLSKIGIIGGTTQKLLNTPVANLQSSDVATLNAGLSNLMQVYTRFTSGAQANQFEQLIIKKDILPALNDKVQTFEQKIDLFENLLKRIEESKNAGKSDEKILKDLEGALPNASKERQQQNAQTFSGLVTEAPSEGAGVAQRLLNRRNR